ncbi:hypothetical protein J1N35_018469 [Gossypium stocksii]|uniref:Uncharacterized protein n=1 Tax=Gossypium stocksii TaxID=47602 RepID=A0A9D3VQE3_9ROSI|nr:hypothetical protein J1N35_018469 [Gossypium stocksii]
MKKENLMKLTTKATTKEAILKKKLKTLEELNVKLKKEATKLTEENEDLKKENLSSKLAWKS